MRQSLSALLGLFLCVLSLPLALDGLTGAGVASGCQKEELVSEYCR